MTILIPVPGSFLLVMLRITVTDSAWSVFTSMGTKNWHITVGSVGVFEMRC